MNEGGVEGEGAEAEEDDEEEEVEGVLSVKDWKRPTWSCVSETGCADGSAGKPGRDGTAAPLG